MTALLTSKSVPNSFILKRIMPCRRALSTAMAACSSSAALSDLKMKRAQSPCVMRVTLVRMAPSRWTPAPVNIMLR